MTTRADIPTIADATRFEIWCRNQDQAGLITISCADHHRPSPEGWSVALTLPGWVTRFLTDTPSEPWGRWSAWPQCSLFDTPEAALAEIGQLGWTPVPPEDTATLTLTPPEDQ